jgi:branched-chain amino acid transport system permease protein
MEATQQPGMRNTLQRTLDALGLTPLGALAIAFLLVLPLIPPFTQEYLRRWLTLAAFIAGQAIAFDFCAGYISVVNFGFAAFVGLGGYTSALLVKHLGISPWMGLFFGAFSSAILGFFTGVLTLRLRGIFALCLAWFVGLAVMGLALKMVWLTRGPLGLRCPVLFETASNLPYFYTIVTMVLVAYFVMRRIVRSDMGLAFKAIGQSMEAAKTSGINPVHYRIFNFTVSCAFAGWMGGFYAHYLGILTPDLMDTGKTVEVLVITYIGGRGSLWGGPFAAFPFFTALEMMRSSLSKLPGSNLVIYGLFLILVTIYYPGGMAQLYQDFFVKSKSRMIRWFTNRPTA